MPVENTSANGFREISEGLIVCNSCGKIHQLYGANRKPLKCETCSERFVNAPSAEELVGEEVGGDIVHYEVDCPECKNHYEIDVPSGPVIFDCEECGCSFTVEQESEFRKSGSQAQAAEAVEEIRSGRSKKRHLPKRATLSLSKQKNKYPWLNSMLSFLVATTVCIGFVVYLIVQAFEEREITPGAQQQDIGPKLVDIDNEVADEVENLFAIRNLSDREAAGFIGVLEGFVGARTIEEKAKFCRFPGVARVRMQDYYANVIYEGESLVDQDRVGSVQLVALPTGQQFFQARFRDKNGSESVYVGEALGGGRFAFEWEPTVLFSEHPWDEIVAGSIDQSTTAMVRIQKSTLYTRELSLDKFASYEVFRKSIGDGFVAYAELGSEAERRLSEVFASSQFPFLGVNDRLSTKHVVLKFDFPKEWNPDGRSRFGRIVEIVQDDWIRHNR